MDIKDIIELNNGKQYIITSKAKYLNDEYLYIAEISEENNIEFCRIINENNQINLAIVKDDDLIKELIPLFTDNLNNFINE